MKRRVGICIGMLLLLSCTTLTSWGQRPRIIHHPRPALSVDMTPFEEAGCTVGEYGLWDCPAESPIAAFGCDQIETPTDLLGGFEPNDALAVCWLSPLHQEDYEDGIAQQEQIEREGYFYNGGCMLPTYARYIVAHNGTFTLLKTPNDLREHFGPAYSYDEALSYALAVTGHDATYGLKAEPGYRYLTDTLEDTYVLDSEEDAYIINLYHYQFCGCGPHTTSTVNVVVSYDGYVTELNSKAAYEDPSEDGLCVD